jgi:SMC interacting uncharacterized protein involved in chromosome segregation
MSTTHETPRDLRKKLSRAAASHKALKNKYREKQYDLKKLNNCLSAMQNSRDKWRLHAKEQEIFTNNLKRELCSISKERDDLRTQVATIELLDQKKTR